MLVQALFEIVVTLIDYEKISRNHECLINIHRHILKAKNFSTLVLKLFFLLLS